MKGLITRIQRFSTTNGPGIRSTVFMKGCPLRCLWCHNPETQKMKPELLFYKEQCIRCGTCEQVCPGGAARFREGSRDRMKESCTLCGVCVSRCPVEALEISGTWMEAEEVCGRLSRDKAFYKNSGGGITLSGGEPLFQPAFTEEVLRRCKAEGLHTCLDTSGIGAEGADIARLAGEKLADLFLFDLKESDEERHREVTGVPFSPVLRSLEAVSETGGQIRLRCPVIPGVNDREAHMERIGGIAEELEGVLCVDLVPYHRLGLVKAEALGEQQRDFGSLSAEEKDRLIRCVQGKTGKPVMWI